MSTNHTKNYDLCQWEETDKVLRTEFNEDNAKIDGALTALSTAGAAEAKARTDADVAEAQARAAGDSALNAALALRGNCQIYTTTYTGTGAYGKDHPSILTFPKPPILVMVFMQNSAPPSMIAPRGISCVIPFAYNVNFTSVQMTWSGNRISWWCSQSAYNQMSSENTNYFVVALLKAD